MDPEEGRWLLWELSYEHNLWLTHSQHESHSPLVEGTMDGRPTFLRAGSKQLRPFLTMPGSLTDSWTLLQVIFMSCWPEAILICQYFLKIVLSDGEDDDSVNKIAVMGAGGPEFKSPASI